MAPVKGRLCIHATGRDLIDDDLQRQAWESVLAGIDPDRQNGYK